MKKSSHLLLLFFMLLHGKLMSAELTKAEIVSIMPRGLFVHQSVVVRNYLYVMGGHGSGRRLPDVYFSRISSDGKLSTWKKTIPLPEGKNGTMAHSVAVYKNFIYSIAGTYKDPQDKKWKATGNVVFTKVNEDGTVTEWKETSPLPEPQSYGMAVAGSNNCIYYLSGYKSRQVYFARIQEDGSLSKWKVTRNLISPRCRSKAFFYHDYLYVLGGEIIYKKYSEIVFRTKVNPDGSVGKWRRTEPLPEKVASFGAVRSGKDIFIFGGAPQTSKVFTTTIDNEDHFSDWKQLQSLPIEEGVSSLQAATYRDYIYVTGGITMGQSNKVHKTVIRYKIINRN